MSGKFKIVEMKIDGGSWRVKFSGVPNAAGFGGATISLDLEEFRGPELGMHEFTPEEIIAKAHRALISELQSIFKASVMSVPQIDWETTRSLTISEILRDLGLDDGA